MKEMNFANIINENKLLENKLVGIEPIRFRLMANISITQLTQILEYNLRKENIAAFATIGDYDNIIQEASRIDKNQIPIIFWELSNIKESFVYEIESENEDFYLFYLGKVQSELQLVFNKLSSLGIVLFNGFSHLPFTANRVSTGKFEKFVNELNVFLEQNCPSNFVIIDTNKPLVKTGLDNAIDKRGIYLSKSFYTVQFFKNYVLHIEPIILSILGKSKKAVIFDCDNTLWKGVVGEEGVGGIGLSNDDKAGIYFKEVHLLAKALGNRGVIIGLCSKNNPEDVEEVFTSRKDFLLKNDDIIIKKVNWIDKATNLNEIANELNIGVDSLVFVDDSTFELNLISSKIPSVKTIAVPQNLYDYPALILSNFDLFFSLNLTKEDTSRLKMYREKKARELEMQSYENIEDYLKSLQIELIFYNKNENSFDRCVQLTQKTNQFNLTTKRYTNGDMRLFFDSPEYDVITMNVSDKFGHSGITGLAIIRYDTEVLIDSFLLSCRILGRNIEKVFIQEIIKKIYNSGNKIIKANYLKTPKNKQVEFFYETNGFEPVYKSDLEKTYVHNPLNSDNFSGIDYINVKWES